jgi:hypothetical protein
VHIVVSKIDERVTDPWQGRVAAATAATLHAQLQSAGFIRAI